MGSEDYLKNVGNFVAAALDPLGIDVKIDIETPEGRKSCQVSSATSSSSSTTTVEEKEEATKKDEEVVVDDQDKEPEASKKATTPSDDEEEWTVVSDKEDDHQGSLYPDLTEAKPEEAATESSPTPTAPVANHPDPRIQVALQAMMNMGFTNDGGWLSSLLEAK